MFPICALIEHKHGLICPRECTHAAISERIGLVSNSGLLTEWNQCLHQRSGTHKYPAAGCEFSLKSMLWNSLYQLALPFLPSLYISLCLKPLSKSLHLIAANTAFLNYPLISLLKFWFLPILSTSFIPRLLLFAQLKCSNTLTSNSQEQLIKRKHSP